MVSIFFSFLTIICPASFHLLNKERGGDWFQELNYLYMYPNMAHTTLD